MESLSLRCHEISTWLSNKKGDAFPKGSCILAMVQKPTFLVAFGSFHGNGTEGFSFNFFHPFPGRFVSDILVPTPSLANVDSTSLSVSASHLISLECRLWSSNPLALNVLTIPLESEKDGAFDGR